jgi:hypothetical protein
MVFSARLSSDKKVDVFVTVCWWPLYQMVCGLRHVVLRRAIAWQS